MAKLESVVGSEARLRLRRFQAQTHLSATRGQVAPVGKVLEALNGREVLAMDYAAASPGATTRREIEPVGLVRVGNAWLVVAYCRLRQDVRAFRIDRIRQLRVTGEQFQPREGFSFPEIIERQKRRPRSS
jgi:proteasome accessory factor B